MALCRLERLLHKYEICSFSCPAEEKETIFSGSANKMNSLCMKHQSVSLHHLYDTFSIYYRNSMAHFPKNKKPNPQT